jgi:hypothetical protein
MTSRTVALITSVSGCALLHPLILLQMITRTFNKEDEDGSNVHYATFPPSGRGRWSCHISIRRDTSFPELNAS